MPILCYSYQNTEFRVDVLNRMIIGSAPENELCVPVPSLFRHHALLTRNQQSQFHLFDYDHKNSIGFEGKTVGSVHLTHGTRFSLGEIAFTFLEAEEIESAPMPEETTSTTPEVRAVPAAAPLQAAPPTPAPPSPEPAVAPPEPVVPAKDVVTTTLEEPVPVAAAAEAPPVLGEPRAAEVLPTPRAPAPPAAAMVRPEAPEPVLSVTPAQAPAAITVAVPGSPAPEVQAPAPSVAPPSPPLPERVLPSPAPMPTPVAEVLWSPPSPEPSAGGASASEAAEFGRETDVAFADQEKAVAMLSQAKERVLAEIGKVIVGQREVLDQILAALFARGHCLLIGVPGLAKTLMVKVVGRTINLDAKRIQFTPDLMPSDITGTDILEEDATTGRRNFRFHRGPLFTNLLLADEINRTPPKTQAALLEAMQEYRVTVAGTGYPLPDPFMVLATQNPIEQEGTYPLPEAQLDRFMFCIHLTYPSALDEQRVLLETTRDVRWDVSQVLSAADILRFQHLVRQVPVSQHVALYALNLIRATRPNAEGGPEFVNRWVRWGAGTRAGQYLLLAAKAHVLLHGRFSVACADVRTYALPVLRHRIFTNFTAASEGISTDQIIQKIVETVREPAY